MDSLHGWAVGQSGTIAATTDGGATWVLQRSGTFQTLQKVTLTSTLSVRVAGGSFGVVLGSENGGY